MSTKTKKVQTDEEEPAGGGEVEEAPARPARDPRYAMSAAEEAEARAAIVSRRRQTAEKLSNESRVRVLVPSGSPLGQRAYQMQAGGDSYVRLSINGHVELVPLDREVSLPKSMAELLLGAMRAEAEAEKKRQALSKRPADYGILEAGS